MKKLRLIALFVVLAAMVMSANAAVASNGAPTQVSIVSDMTFNNPNPNTGTFTTSGPAADSGLICPSGTVFDTGFVFSGFQGRDGFNVLVRKTFTCADGSGTFFVKIQVHGEFDGTERFSWVVQGGTGSYGNLHGSGSGSTVPRPGGNTNTYAGFLIG